MNVINGNALSWLLDNANAQTWLKQCQGTQINLSNVNVMNWLKQCRGTQMNFINGNVLTWLQQRAGKITASRFADVLSRQKNGKDSMARERYKLQLAIERITGAPVTQPDNQAMRWGRENEPMAIEEFEKSKNLIGKQAMVEPAGLIDHPELENVACSPDGLIGADSGIEIKCPFNTENHIFTILNGMPNKHKAQVQGCMMVTERESWHFVSFDPRLPNHLKIYHEVILRDEEYIEKLKQEIIKFDDEVSELIEEINEKGSE